MAAFAEVLDAFVDRVGSAGGPAAAPWHPGIATRPLLRLEGSAVAPHPRPVSMPGPVTFPTQAVRQEVPRPKRVLSADQRAAFDQLLVLGARLRIDFTRGELRSQFRILARVLHPDRHPGGSAQEKSRLAASFAALRSAYDRLTPACEPTPRS
jgi:hypothetical protein